MKNKPKQQKKIEAFSPVNNSMRQHHGDVESDNVDVDSDDGNDIDMQSIDGIVKTATENQILDTNMF